MNDVTEAEREEKAARTQHHTMEINPYIFQPTYRHLFAKFLLARHKSVMSLKRITAH
jgi:hypothetical protein